jgi:hypothetical protein
MIDFLTYTLCALAIFQPTLHRFFVASTFAGLTYAHNLHLYELEGFAYYGSDALVYLAVMVITGKLATLDDFTISTHRPCLGAIILDFFGWVIYMLYFDPDPYNAAFGALYALAIATLITRGRANDRGGYTVGNWPDYVHSIAWARNTHLQSGKNTP